MYLSSMIQDAQDGLAQTSSMYSLHIPWNGTESGVQAALQDLAGNQMDVDRDMAENLLKRFSSEPGKSRAL